MWTCSQLSRIPLFRTLDGRGGAREGAGAVPPRRGMLATPSAKNFVSVEEFSTENCVPMHKRYPLFCFLAPLSEISPRVRVNGILPPLLISILINGLVIVFIVQLLLHHPSSIVKKFAFWFITAYCFYLPYFTLISENK